MTDRNEELVLAGAAKTDITPPLEVGLLMSSVEARWESFASVRMPLLARVITLRSGNCTIALVSADLLGVHEKAVFGWERFKRSISGDHLRAENIIFSCTHTHNAPESAALSNLYTTGPYRQWLHQAEHRIADAIRDALNNMQPVSIAAGDAALQGYSLQRRVPTASGMVISDSLQPIPDELFQRGPIDRRIRCIWLTGPHEKIVATIVWGSCHPVHEMCMKHVSPDFPGECCRIIDDTETNGMGFYLNGAAADINPPTVSNGSYYAHAHGAAIAAIADSAFTRKQQMNCLPLCFIRDEFELHTRFPERVAARERCTVRLTGIRIGQLAIIFLPGEPFAETGLAIEMQSPFPITWVAGYSENYVGYIPPEHVFSEGGYETGPGTWSFLEQDAERIIREKAVTLLKELWRNET